MKHLRTKHYILLFMAFLASLASCAAYGLMYRAVDGRSVDALNAEAEIASAGQDQVEAVKIAELYSSTALSRSTLPAFFASTSDAVPFIDSVEAVGKESGAAVSISSIGAAPSAQANAIDAHVSVSGSWQDVMRGVGLVENLPYAVSVARLDLATDGPSASSKAPQWSASMDISVLSD